MKLLRVVLLSLVVSSCFGQASPRYQVAVIVDVKPHPDAAENTSSVISYDVSVKVDETIYTVLYKPKFDLGTIKYAAGRSLLVVVGEKTISYNDLLGQSFEVPIINRKPASAGAQTK